jgi:hypothetical protein
MAPSSSALAFRSIFFRSLRMWLEFGFNAIEYAYFLLMKWNFDASFDAGAYLERAICCI